MGRPRRSDRRSHDDRVVHEGNSELSTIVDGAEFRGKISQERPVFLVKNRVEIELQVFLGQKYGYRPIPTYILSSELLLIRDELVATGNDGTLIDTWYRKDSNAVPPVSVLQPISSILINFNNKVRNLIARREGNVSSLEIIFEIKDESETKQIGNYS